ncbi:MAG: ABC transporter ATP-binding protein [Methylobacteriaceae bacterium]|nr:ABC transporter ATP-binding protein [Methylobacteriaceae bacterium]
MFVDTHGSGFGPAPPEILRVEDLRIAFALHHVLGSARHNEVVKGASFRIPAGRTVALVGESGSGKSVISQAIMGLLPRVGAVTGGRILFHDPAKPKACVDLAALMRDGPEFRALRGGRIGMIFQEPMSSLSPVHTVGDQIEEALQLHQPVARAEARAKTEAMLRLVGFRDPQGGYDKYAFELSGGLRQRAMLAMALICRPALLIADEPTTALDVTIQAQVLKLMKDLQREIGMAILLITHDLGVVANMADEVVVIYHGEIMEAGTVEDIFRRPAHPYLKALLKATPRFDMDEGERLVSLRESGSMPMARKPERISDTRANVPAMLISAQSLRKVYHARRGGWLGRGKAIGIPAVDDVSLEIKRGECLGLVGESGCGKTTLSKIMMRAVTPDQGAITYCDGSEKTDVLALKGQPLRQFRRRMQLIFQDPVGSLSPRMTVLSLLREPLDIHGEAAGKQRVKDLMRAVGLDPRFLNRYPHSFSGGQRQRIGIARALALDPDIIVCDEPVSALDVSVHAQILNLLKDLQRDRGLTYLFISHNLAVVGYMADRIAVMARGRIVETAPRHELFRGPAHPYTKRLLNAVPFADLDHRLDFSSVTLASASDPSLWPPAFRDDGNRASLKDIDLGGGHYVLARESADARDLRP